MPDQVLSTSSQVASWLSAEERRAVLEKMIATLKTPVGTLPRDQSLYLEQQVSDLLGFEVSSELDQQALPYSYGSMAALPHLKRHPQDALADHHLLLEAGLAPRRSGFGWFTEMGQLTEAAFLREKYFLSLPIDLLPSWRTHAKELMEWYKYRKMVVINPYHELAIVGSVCDVGPATWRQHQFGGSPELTQQLQVWDLVTQGKVFVYFVNDPTDKIALGPVSMSNTL